MRSEWMLLGVLILSATGCENAAEQEQVRVLSARRAAGNVTYSCSQKMEQSAEYQALKGKLPPLDGSPPPMSLQLNTAKPTADEAKTVLSFYEGQVVPCRGTVRDAYRNVTPAMVAIMDRGDADSDMAYARLIKREVSWGDYAQADYQRNIKTRDQLQQAQNQLNQDLGKAVGKETERRRDIVRALTGAIPDPAPTYVPPRTTTMNCTSGPRYSGTVNCTQY